MLTKSWELLETAEEPKGLEFRALVPKAFTLKPWKKSVKVFLSVTGDSHNICCSVTYTAVKCMSRKLVWENLATLNPVVRRLWSRISVNIPLRVEWVLTWRVGRLSRLRDIELNAARALSLDLVSLPQRVLQGFWERTRLNSSRPKSSFIRT